MGVPGQVIVTDHPWTPAGTGEGLKFPLSLGTTIPLYKYKSTAHGFR